MIGAQSQFLALVMRSLRPMVRPQLLGSLYSDQLSANYSQFYGDELAQPEEDDDYMAMEQASDN